RVTREQLVDRSIGGLRIQSEIGVVVSRLRRDSELIVPTKYTVLRRDDVLTAVGTEAALKRAAQYFGEVSSERLDARRDRVDMRRVLVSKREHIGRSIEELELERRFNAQVTRLRRADLDLVPSP